MSAAIGNLINAGGAFKNPFTASFAAFSGTMTASSLTSPSSPVYATLQTEQITNITAAFTTLETQMTAFQTHTDLISGVTTGGNTSMAQMAQIMSVVRVAQAQPTCSQFNQAFGAILAAASILKDLATLVALVENLIKNPHSYIDQVISNLNALATRLANQAAQDQAAFESAAASAAANALGSAIVSLLGDTCFANVVGTIATNAMKQELNAVKPASVPTIL